MKRGSSVDASVMGISSVGEQNPSAFYKPVAEKDVFPILERRLGEEPTLRRISTISFRSGVSWSYMASLP